MLKITWHNQEAMVLLKLEGRLMGKYVAELQACYQAACQLPAGQQICLDLSEVTFVDCEGRAALASIYTAGVEILATNVLTQFIAEELTAHEEQPI